MALDFSVRCLRTCVTTKEEVTSLVTYKDGLGRPLEKRAWSAECVDCSSHTQNPNPGQPYFTSADVGKDLSCTESRNARGVISKAMPTLSKGPKARILLREPVPTLVG